jgi:hypothetical protein
VEDREALRLAKWVDSLGVSLRRMGTNDGGSPTKKRQPLGGGSGGGAAVGDAVKGMLAPAAELAAACSDGTLLCELVGLLDRKTLEGVTW